MEKSGFDAYTLKLLAIIGMVLQHTAIIISDLIPQPLQWPMHVAGGLTFPIMAFMLVEGYNKTSNRKKYSLRLFAFAVISQIPYMLGFRAWALNIMFTLLFGLLLFMLYDKLRERRLQWLFWIVFVIYTIASLFFLDWGLFGPVMLLLYHIIKNDGLRRWLPGVIIGAAMLVMGFLSVMTFTAIETLTPEMAEMLGIDDIEQVLTKVKFGLAFAVGIFIPALLLRKYNGQRGKSMRYLFYIVYPAHLLILALIAHAAGIRELGFSIGL